jgi:hypothetical protein
MEENFHARNNDAPGCAPGIQAKHLFHALFLSEKLKF